MSYFDSASLVMIPSGYKDQKVYSVKPIDGSGDFTFTRSNDTATRVASNGLIEKVRTNALLQSNSFDTTWGLVLLSTTSGQTDPDGGTTAWKISETTNDLAGYAYIGQTISSNTFSFYAKAGEITEICAYIGGSRGAYFDLTDGSFVGYYSGVTDFTYNSISVGGGWYRYSISHSGLVAAEIYTAESGSIYHDLVIGDGFYLWHAQAEASDVATDYIATTSAAVSVGMLANTPRLDYSGGASCPKLLLEPQTTALNQFSEQIDNAYWFKANCTVTANQTASPSGYVDADLVLDNTVNNQHSISRSIAVTSGNKYTASFFLKAAGYTTAAIRMGAGSLWTGGTGPTVEFDLVALTGTVVDGSGVTFTIEDYGNGWRRCSVTGTCVTSGNTAYSLYVKQYNAYIGSGTDGVYAWGANITATDYLQSYIPTLEAAVTRVIERFNKTGISSLINSQEGTFFVEMATFSDNVGTRILSLSDGSVNNNLYIGYTPTTNRISAVFSSGGTAQAALNTTAFNITEQNKIAVSYKTNEFKMYVNGTLIGTDTSVTMPAAGTLSQLKSDFGQGSFPLEASLKQAIIFPTALTDAQLAELTTL